MGNNLHYFIPTRTNTIQLIFYYTLAFFFVLNCNFSYAQSNTPAQKNTKVPHEWEVGIFLGGGTIFGDTPEDNVDATFAIEPAFGLSVNRNITQNLSIRGGITYATLKNDRNFKNTTDDSSVRFKLKMTDFSGALYYEPNGENRYPLFGRFKQILSPYFFIGVGASYGEAETVYENVENTPKIILDDQEKTEYRANLLLGTGLKYDISRTLAIAIEVGIRPTADDFLDGISHNGNPNKNDWYGFGGFTLHYRLGQPDADGDGIADAEDKCPGAPGLKKFKGCPDSDGDGIKNSKDDCPSVAGSSVLNGCPDADRDGIADHLDDCPNTKGMMRMNGCPDKDWDYVIDSQDECPDVPGLVELKGCPKAVVIPEAETFAAVEKENLDTFPSIEKIDPPVVPKTPIIENTIINKPIIEEITPQEVKNTAPEKPIIEESLIQNMEIIEEVEERIEEELVEKSIVETPTIPEFERAEFELNSNQFSQETYQILINIAETLPQYPDHILHISAYAEIGENGTVNSGIAGKRVFSCYKYLLQKGVPAAQLVYYNYKKLPPTEEEAGKVIFKLKE